MSKYAESHDRQGIYAFVERYQAYLVPCLFIALTCVASRNVLENLEGIIVGNDNDVFINPWADWWTLRALQESEVELWRTDYLFYPSGVSLSFHSFSHLNSLVSLALRPFFGPLPAYNLAILLNYPLSALAMFQLARYVTGSVSAALIASIVFAFNSHNLYQSSHPVLVSIWCFPWVTLLYMRAMREKCRKLAVAAALIVFLGAASSILLAILMALWLVLLTSYMWLSEEWTDFGWRTVAALAVPSALFVLPLVYPLLLAAISGGDRSYLSRPSDSIVADMFSPFVPHWYVWLTRGLYFGVVPFYLLMLAFGMRRRASRLWRWLLLIAYLLAIGPTPELFGRKLGITLPWSLVFTPLLRNAYRFNILLSLGLAMCTAFGWLAIADRLKSIAAKRVVAAALAGVIFIECTLVPFPSTRVTVSPFFSEVLPKLEDDSAIAVLPTGRQVDKKRLYDQTIHGRKMVGGVVSRFSQDTFRFILGNGVLRAAAVDLPPARIPKNIVSNMEQLVDFNVGYLVLEKALMDVEPWRYVLAKALIYEDDYLVAYDTRLWLTSHSLAGSNE